MDITRRALGLLAVSAPVVGWDVSKYGATGGGNRLDTKAIQRAVDECARAGGGMVNFPSGRYLSGTIFLKSGVLLHLAEGSVLLGSKDLKDYPATPSGYRCGADNYSDKSLLYGENLERIGILGKGTIDGQGAAFRGDYKARPYILRLITCQDVTVQDVKIRNSPMWVQHYLACDGVYIRGITVASRVNQNNDGIDIDSCHRVRISDCDISSGDDAIVLKSTSDRACRDVVITNCVLSSLCNALKAGTESNGGFENIAISNCSIYDTRLSGIALESVDGGALNQVVVSNIVMSNTRCAIFVRLGDRARPFKEGMEKPGVGSLRNVILSNIQATGADRIGCAICGIPGHPVENLTLQNVSISFEGGGTQADAQRKVPEYPERYPEYKMFGVLPAYGIYCRHAKNVRLDHVQLTPETPDARPPLVTEDVEGFVKS
jgi:polygalacturonase